jgi:hypothetical protein
MVCQATPGSLIGVCAIPLPPAAPDAGVSGGPDAGGSTDAPLICAYYGQSCSTSTPCCNLPCVNSSNVLCGPGDVDCLCWVAE